MCRTAVALLLLLLPLLSAALKIGRVSDLNDDVQFTTEEFWSRDLSLSLTFQPVTRQVQWWNTLDVVVAMCKLTDSGIQALVAEAPQRLRSLVAVYSEHMQLPSVGGVVDVSPDTCSAAVQFVRKWKSFAFIYQTEKGPSQLESVLRLLDSSPVVEAFWRTNGVQETVELVKTLPSTPLLLAVSESSVDPLISSLASLRRNFDIVLLTPVVGIRKRNHPGSYRLIQFSAVDRESSSFQKLEKEVSESIVFNHEARKILQNFFSNVNFPGQSPPHLSCFNYTTGIEPQVLKEVKVEDGLTGDIEFNSAGNRKEYKLDVYEEKPFDLKKIGWWSEKSGLQVDKSALQMMSPTAFKVEAAPPIRVTSVLVKPFLFEGPDRKLEGYVVDFLDELMAILQRPYQLQLVKDGGYGRKIGSSWNGMVGELIRDEADMAVAPLTKTREREEVVDFSKNFMTVGLNILLKKPLNARQERFGPFSFLTVWSPEMWTVLVLSAVLFGGACYLISRYVGPPDRVRALESKGTDKLSPCGSFWFTQASVLGRDTGIYPRTLSHRVWASLWWTLCIFLAVGYVSYLSAALLQTRRSITTTYSRKTSHEVIQDALEKGSPAIGTVKSGSTTQFFLNSNIGLYQRLGRYLESNPSMLTKGYDEGVQRVRQSGGEYAYIMESPSSEFHADTEPCDLVVTSGFLTTKSHAVALQKNSLYKEMVDHGVLMLMESGALRHLYEKWWHNYTNSCQDPSLDILPHVYNKSLRLSEVSGVFYTFIVFVIASGSVTFIEKYTSARKINLDRDFNKVSL